MPQQGFASFPEGILRVPGAFILKRASLLNREPAFLHGGHFADFEWSLLGVLLVLLCLRSSFEFSRRNL